MLGEEAQEVGIIAVSVDPDRDSVQQAHDYSERWRMVDTWSFLVGEEADLQPSVDCLLHRPGGGRSVGIAGGTPWELRHRERRR